jgi:hypothetical protein
MMALNGDYNDIKLNYAAMIERANTIKRPVSSLWIMSSVILGILMTFFSAPANAGGVYMEPDAFINQVFDNTPPKPQVLWLKKELKAQIIEILEHKYKGLRVRYWQQEIDNKRRTAWILDEIGKEKPITVGLVVNDQKIELVKVLVFRESRGWEVRHDFFTKQFKQAALKDDNRLDKHIDNISGATLSVRALTKLARIALLLDRQLDMQAGS